MRVPKFQRQRKGSLWPWGAPSQARWLSIHGKPSWQKHKENFLAMRVWLCKPAWFFFFSHAYNDISSYFKIKPHFHGLEAIFPCFSSSLVYPVIFFFLWVSGLLASFQQSLGWAWDITEYNFIIPANRHTYLILMLHTTLHIWGDQ